MGSYCLIDRILQDVNVLEMESGDVCTTLNTVNSTKMYI